MISIYETALYLIIRADMVLTKQFKKVTSHIIKNHITGQIGIKIVIQYKNQDHSCYLKISKPLKKNIADQQIYALCEIIDKKLNLNSINEF
jgi:hypothetical protein